MHLWEEMDPRRHQGRRSARRGQQGHPPQAARRNGKGTLSGDHVGPPRAGLLPAGCTMIRRPDDFPDVDRVIEAARRPAVLDYRGRRGGKILRTSPSAATSAASPSPSDWPPLRRTGRLDQLRRRRLGLDGDRRLHPGPDPAHLRHETRMTPHPTDIPHRKNAAEWAMWVPPPSSNPCDGSCSAPALGRHAPRREGGFDGRR